MTDEYIKMIIALDPKFFENWELNDGDQVYLLKDIDDYTNSREYGLYTVFDRLLAHEGVNDTENWHYVKWMLADGVIRPIPRQEQLQDMMKKYYRENRKRYMQEDPTDFELLQRFIEMLLCAPDASKGDSIKIMWLKCLVWEMYELNWNGDSWI